MDRKVLRGRYETDPVTYSGAVLLAPTDHNILKRSAGLSARTTSF